MTSADRPIGTLGDGPGLMSTARYHAQVSLVGRSYLRGVRLREEWRQRQRQRSGAFARRNPQFGPPISTVPRLKELISAHYLEGRYARPSRKVAWVTSGAPVEFLVALDYHLFYPENHGAVCGVRRTAVEMCSAAEEKGYSRDLCSYARTDFGSILTGKTPVGVVPPPDLLVCCTNICQTVLHWYRVLAEHFKVPLVLIDTPFLYDEAPPHAVRFVERQIEEAMVTAERVAGRLLDARKLRRAMELSFTAVSLWAEVMQRGTCRPAPILAFDEFFHMSPIVQMRGQLRTVRYYEALLAELERRSIRFDFATDAR